MLVYQRVLTKKKQFSESIGSHWPIGADPDSTGSQAGEESRVGKPRPQSSSPLIEHLKVAQGRHIADMRDGAPMGTIPIDPTIDFQGPKTSGGKRRAGADEPGGKTLAGTNVCETIV